MAYIGKTSPLFQANETYMQEVYDRYRSDPDSVGPEWAEFFAALSQGTGGDSPFAHDRGPSWSPRESRVVGSIPGRSLADMFDEQSQHGNPYEALIAELRRAQGPGASEKQIRQAAKDSANALMLIRAYRVRGHMHAQLDPLGMEHRGDHPELNPEQYGFDSDDWDRPIFINKVLGLETATLRQIVDICNKTYCDSIGVEFMHIQDPEEKFWIQKEIESTLNRKSFTDLGRQTILERLTQADVFETYLDKKYRGTKRFGLDGGESLVPMMEQIFKYGGQSGLEEVVIGMAHRGRLNVLANVMHKPYRAIFAEFDGLSSSPEGYGSGDVKYHLGASANRKFDNHTVHLSLTPNPSHLEAVNTVVLGKVRAKQQQRGDQGYDKVMGVLLHGDAAFIGQGIVAETFLLSQLKGYRTGGTIHIVINNQIGFTTSPIQSRSSPYCSDMARAVNAPVFHVNGDDPEACVHVARLAVEYRQKFKKDVVVDMWCYRRHGHNEGDEPKFTQPLMYKKIAEHPRVRQVYAERLEAEGVLPPGGGEKMIQDFRSMLEEDFKAAKSYRPNKADWLEGRWTGLTTAKGESRRGETSVEESLLQEVGQAITKPLQNFNTHPKILRMLKKRRQMVETGEGIDWGMGEALAFGTLLCEATSIRLSGEDSQRGTFSHRHAVLVDQETEAKDIPLNRIRPGQAQLEVIDSPLSEFGLLGYEYGYASAEPQALVLWEAQFGDFANGAQVIIDQFVSSGETKWLRMNGLVMLLPHGFEGQGPEHSSARLERYLQLCAEDNMQVCNITTPANFFHALRRQMRRDFRKPLIQMTPKSLLRHKKCVSSLADFAHGSTFHRVLVDGADGTGQLAADKDIRRVVLCSGKVYFDLEDERDKRGLRDIQLLRLEQFYPFPEKPLLAELKRFPNAELVWCQEEPQNSGAWFFVDRRLEALLQKAENKVCSRPRYVGRREAASPATGSAKRHAKEQATLINEALSFEQDKKQ